MQIILTRLALALGILAIACGGESGTTPIDAGGIDANFLIPPSGCDQPGGELCDLSTEICFEGSCAPNACLTEANDCGEAELCQMECVPLGDACDGVTCEGDFTCYQGNCVAGCFPASPCLGVECETGQYCRGGSCFDLNACEGECPEGFACDLACKKVSPCQDVDCEEGEVCISGECLVNPCYGIDCADGAVCVNGECIDTCSCEPCEPYEICIFGECECAPDCDDKTCGDDDGCGGKCDSCPTEGDICNTSTGECSCNPSCSGLACGEYNACGAPCTACPGQGTCDVDAPGGPVCVCETGVECDDGDCCSASNTCIDTNGNAETNQCCQPDRVCDQHPSGNDRCCGGSQDCVTAHGCCNNNDICDDPDVCLCGGGQIAHNCGNGDSGDDFCCKNANQACEQTGECCGNGFTCFDSNDSDPDPTQKDDTCCTVAGWCEDSRSCCGAGETCYNDRDCGDNGCAPDPDPPLTQNDTCCAPDCSGKSCGDDDGCGGLCVVESCGQGQYCHVEDIDNVYCDDAGCNPACNPCDERCIAGECVPKCDGDFELNPLTCECEDPNVEG